MESCEQCVCWADGSICAHAHGVTPHLLLRAHDNVKDSAALLGVVDLKDAPRAPERRGRVPRLKEEHRVANGIDAVAEAVDV